MANTDFPDIVNVPDPNASPLVPNPIVPPKQTLGEFADQTSVGQPPDTTADIFLSHIVQMRQRGLTNDQIDRLYVRPMHDKAISLGVTEEQFLKSIGANGGDPTQIDNAGRAGRPPEKQSDVFSTVINSFLNEDPLGNAVNLAVKQPELGPQDLDMIHRLAKMTGANVTTLAATATMATAGATVGAFGGPADVVTVPLGAVIGGSLGWFFPDWARNIIGDVKKNGGMSNEDIAARLAVTAWQSAKETAPVAGMIAGGALAAPIMAAAGAGAGTSALGIGAAELAGLVGTTKLMTGAMPSGQDLADQVAFMLLFHGMKATPAAVRGVRNALVDNWVKYNQSPKEAAAGVQAGTQSLATIDGQLQITVPPGGEPKTPPVSLAKQPSIRKVAKEAATTVDDLLHETLTGRSADDIEMRKRVEALPPEISKPPVTGAYSTLDEKFYHHQENPQAHPLTVEEQKVWDENAVALNKMEEEARTEAEPFIVRGSIEAAAIDPENYIHRIPVGKGSEQDFASGEQVRAPFLRSNRRTSRLSTSTPSAKPTTYYTLVDRAGNRMVVSDYPEGDGVYVHTNGTRSAEAVYGGTGRLIEGKWVEEKTTPEKITVEKVKVPEIKNNDFTKGKVTPGGKDVPEKTTAAHDTYDALVPGSTRLKVGEYFRVAPKGKVINASPNAEEGKTWKIERSNTAELEQHTATRYYKSFFGSKIDNIMRLRQAARNGNVRKMTIDEMVARGMAIRAEGNHFVNGHLTNIPGYEGWLLHPQVAEVLEDFQKGGPRLIDNPPAMLDNANKLAISSMFFSGLGGIAHGRNLYATSFTGRGLDNLRGLPLFSMRAWRAVNDLSPEYIQALRDGASLLSSGVGKDSLAKFVMDRMGQEIARDGDNYNEIAQKLGLPNAVALAKTISNWQSHELFRINDVFYMQRYLELMDKGLSSKEAIKETERFAVPNYRMSSRVGGFRTLARALGDTNITWFGRWTRAKFGILTNMVTSLAEGIKDRDPEVVSQALGRFMAMGVYALVVIPIMSSIGQKITGNKNTEWRPGGILNDIEDAEKEASNPTLQGLFKLGNSFFNPAGVTQEFLDQRGNNDEFTGNPIRLPGAGLQQQIAETLYHALKKEFSFPLTPVEDWAKYLESGAGWNNPSPASMFFKNGGVTQQQSRDAAKARAKAPLLEKLMGGY
jgi:hypothetical protein